MFFKRLFGRKEKGQSEKPATEHPSGVAAQRTQAERDATRKDMESKLTADREHRGATDARPGSDRPAAPDA